MYRKLLISAVVVLAAMGYARFAAAEEDEYAEVRERLELCFGCHGPNGASEQPKYPILAGQHFYYLYVQMKDFKAGRRSSPEMQDIVADMEKSEMRALAKFFSEQKWPNIGYRADRTTAKRGEIATIAGQCVQCHRGGYEGDSRIPRLAGQYFDYLEQTMLDFKTKKRKNSAAKSALLDSYSVEDIAGMAEFLAGM